jgi:hypothetical protein
LSIAQIDYQEEGMDDGEDDCISSSEKEEGMEEPVDDYGDDDNVSEQSVESLAETLDDEPGDYSDGWLNEETPGEESLSGWAQHDQQSESSKNCIMDKDLHSQVQPGPHVRTSAITGVGLPELLELIDEKLRIQDKMMKAGKVAQGGVFGRKWRPPRTEDAGIAVEQ